MVQKELAIQNINKDFKEYANLMMKQIGELENLIQSGSNKFSENDLKNISNAESKLDNYEVKISEQIINTIVLHHPVASELRRLMACYRIVINMERIGDLIMATIKDIIKLEDTKLYEDLSDVIFNMVSSSTSMVEKSIFSFINEDRDSAIWTIKNDEMIDQMNRKLMKKGIKKTKLQDEGKNILMNLINYRSVVTRIERIADHAGHIAEAAIYANEGKEVRHKQL